MRFLIALALLWSSVASAQVNYSPFILSVLGGSGACTDGVDCLCDTISTTSTLLFCQDFEDAGFYTDAADSWRRGSGSPHNRGVDSLWTTRYGNGDGNLFNSSDGVPYLGTQCGYGGAGCSGNTEYCSSAQGALTGAGVADCWGPGSNAKARIDIQRTGDFDDVVGTLTLTGGTGAAADVLGGNAHFAHYIRPGSTAGILGAAWLKAGGIGSSGDNTNATEVGITMKLAYSSNIGTEADSVIDGPWKHDEWSDDSSANQEHWNLGNTGCGDVTEFPYRPFLFHASQAACDAALAGSTDGTGSQIGSADCTSVALRLCSSSAYDQATDFPFGTVGCHQAHIKGLGTSDVDITIKHDGVVVIKLENFDGAGLDNQYYSNFYWNAYSNINEDGDGTTNDTDAAMYRYEDDIVVVNGPPEPCSAIGF